MSVRHFFNCNPWPQSFLTIITVKSFHIRTTMGSFLLTRVTRPQSCYAVTNFSGRSGLGPHWIPLHVIQGGKKWGSSSHDSVKTKTPCHNRCVTIEILPAHRPCKAMSEGLDFVSRHWLCCPLHMNAIFSSKTLNKIQPTNQFFISQRLIIIDVTDYCTVAVAFIGMIMSLRWRRYHIPKKSAVH